MGALQDINGKDSAKRLWAGRYLLFGLIMPIIFFSISLVMDITGKPLIMKFPYEIWFGVVGTGAGLLGFTIFESKVK